MEIKLGVSLVCDRIPELAEWVRAVEDAGFDRMGIGDSPALYPETYVQNTVAALNSNRLKFGPRVATPLNRHPVVTASALAALDELSNGRCYLGFGSGDSAVFSIGRTPASVDRTRAYIVAIKELFAQGHTVFEGNHVAFRPTKRPVPIYLAASGPRMLRMAGELCDGVIVGWGVGPELVPLAMRYIKEGAEQAGRRIEDIDVWWLIGASLGDSQEEAQKAIRTHLAAQANQAFRLGYKGKGIPDELMAPVKQLIAEYDYNEHELPGQEKGNVKRVADLGLTDYFAGRFTVAGTPDQFANRVKELASWGANQLFFTMPLPDKLGFLRTMRDQVFPKLRQ